jgi:hypothetical protein
MIDGGACVERSSVKESIVSVRQKYAADVSQALRRFHESRNRIVVRVLEAEDEFREVTRLNLGDAFSQSLSLQYQALLHPAVSHDEVMKVLIEAFDIATILFTDSERAVIETALNHPGNLLSAEQFGGYHDTVEHRTTLAAHIDAAKSFGVHLTVRSLYAFVLMYGYTAAEVVSLSDDEVIRAFGLIAEFKTHFSWSLITSYLADEIDVALLRSMTGNHAA